jgi:protein-S-isoprenylcysteine O-methyltransferase Ste14
MVALGNFLFRFRTTLSPFLPLLLLLPGPVVLPDPFVAALIGFAVALVGQIVRGTTIGLEYIVRGGRNHRVYADALVTEGLFRHTRNPMYVGKFLMARRRHRVESLARAARVHGRVLADVPGRHARRGRPSARQVWRGVRRYLPARAALLAAARGPARETFATTRFNWTRVLIKAYAEPLGWTLPIVLIALWNIRQTTGLAARPVAVTVLWTLLAVMGLLWLALGALKKTRTLAPSAGS